MTTSPATADALLTISVTTDGFRNNIEMVPPGNDDAVLMRWADQKGNLDVMRRKVVEALRVETNDDTRLNLQRAYAFTEGRILMMVLAKLTKAAGDNAAAQVLGLLRTHYYEFKALLDSIRTDESMGMMDVLFGGSSRKSRTTSDTPASSGPLSSSSSSSLAPGLTTAAPQLSFFQSLPSNVTTNPNEPTSSAPPPQGGEVVMANTSGVPKRPELVDEDSDTERDPNRARLNESEISGAVSFD